MTKITLKAITKVFGSGASAVTAVDDVSVEIAPGELFFLLGPSGCGKTTLLRMIAGLIEPTAGEIFFGDNDVTHLAVEKRDAAMVFQNYALWPHMTVRQNVAFGPKMKGIRGAQRDSLVADSLRRVEMSEYIARKPNELSGGQQQRIAVARVLAAGSACMLLDEPLSNLDARLRMHMRGELRGLVKSTGATAVYVTHDQKEALSMADRIAVMKDGRIVQVACPEELYNRPATRFVADFLGEANFIDGLLTAGATGAHIKTACGRLIAVDAMGLPDGTPVVCCIRPERIEISNSAAGDTAAAEAAIDARIESVTFLGEIRQYLC
ncbi:MAG: ABC transporter ATP-binding protein, partial [Planctomycetes bacterium]|nr:ABC transporter ATP-binding protein [Planctomycetota bacterium]